MATSTFQSASSLAAHLSSFNRQNQVPGQATHYGGPTIQDMRRIPQVANMADQLLEDVSQRAPFLNPRGNPMTSSTLPPPGAVGGNPGQGGHFVGFNSGFQPGHTPAYSLPGQTPAYTDPGQAAGQTLGQTYTQMSAPIVPGINTSSSVIQNINLQNVRQFYPHVYASQNTVSYADKINQNNVNMPNFVYGYSKHLLAILQGRVTNVSPDELTSRVQNLVNIMQVVAINSNMTDFNDYAWQIGREYANRVNRDLEEGAKSWSHFNPNIAADSYVFAKDHVQVVQSSNTSSGQSKDKAVKDPKPPKEGRLTSCKDYNTKANDGESCSWELQSENSGKRCNRLHCCSTCLKTGAQRTHRALNCQNKSKSPFNSQESGS